MKFSGLLERKKKKLISLESNTTREGRESV